MAEGVYVVALVVEFDQGAAAKVGKIEEEYVESVNVERTDVEVTLEVYGASSSDDSVAVEVETLEAVGLVLSNVD